MSTWLKLLPMELEGVSPDDFVEPPHTGYKTDKVVGTMSDICKRLYTLHCQLERIAGQSSLDANYCNDKMEKKRLEAKACECVEKAGTMMAIMWIAIRDEFEIWNRYIGIRIAYKVVTCPEHEGRQMPPLLRDLLGFGGGENE